jgi:hypothetical protein
VGLLLEYEIKLYFGEGICEYEIKLLQYFIVTERIPELKAFEYILNDPVLKASEINVSELNTFELKVSEMYKLKLFICEIHCNKIINNIFIV